MRKNLARQNKTRTPRHLYQAALIVARWIGSFMGPMQNIRIGNLLFERPGLPECKESLGL
jgi:hypothetical protein